MKVFHFYARAPLSLHITEGGRTITHVLGPNLSAGERPQLLVLARVWQAGENLGDWTLIGCMVAPGFEFSGFELAPKDWSP